MTALSLPRGETGASICTSTLQHKGFMKKKRSQIKCNLKGLLCLGDSDFTKWRAEDDNEAPSPDPQ